LKGYKATELVNEFLNKWWTKSRINRLLKQLRDTSTVNSPQTRR